MHDNAPAHQPLTTQNKLAYLGFQYLGQPPYSPDLAPSHYLLFPGLKKKELKSRHFSSYAEVIAARGPGCKDILNFFGSGLQKVEQRGGKYIELRGEYVE